MALPNRSAKPYVVLGIPDDNNPFSARDGTILSDFQDTDNTKPKQLDFYAYQHWLKDYPNQNIAMVMAPGCGLGWLEVELTSSDYEYTYPSDIVYEYDPDPPLSQSAPDPNGDIGTLTGDEGYYETINQCFPRWHTEDAYDFEAIPFPGIIPPSGTTFTFNESYLPGAILGLGYCSYEASVTNFDSQVTNVSTMTDEYYPFLQTTTELKLTTKFKVKPHPDNVYSCWSEGTVIKGKVGFRSYPITANALDNPATPGYGYTGIEVTFGTTSADAGTADWEVTWEDGYTAAEITIPCVLGQVTFINDFWVTEVVKPA